jgi:hypothetical protein
LIIVRGEQDEPISFVVTAMGHGLQSMFEVPQAITGVDAHSAEWLLPVPGVHYLNNPLIQECPGPVLANLRNLSGASKVLINGVVSLLPEANRMAKHTLVIFGERARMGSYSSPSKVGLPVTVIRVTQGVRTNLIHLDFSVMVPDNFQ